MAAPSANDVAQASADLIAAGEELRVFKVPPKPDALAAIKARVADVAQRVASWTAPAPPEASLPVTSPEPEPELPEPGRVIQATPESLGRLLAEGRQPNDRIVLAPGDYPGDLMVNGPARLQIVAAEPLKAILGGAVRLAGVGVILSGVDLDHAGKRSGTSVVVSGTGCRLHRSRIFRKAGTCIDLIGEDCTVEWCDLSVWGKQEVPASMPDGTKFGLIRDDGADGRGNGIRRCWLHDGPLKHPDDYHRYGITGIGVGINPTQFKVETFLAIEENLFEDCGSLDIAIKTALNLIVGNTVLGERSKCVGNNRSGTRNLWKSNWFGKNAFGQSIVVHGGLHVLAGNHVEDPIALKCGNFRWNQVPGGNTRRHAAHGVACVGNDEPPILLGHRYASEGALKIAPTECVFDEKQPFRAMNGAKGRRDDLSAIEYETARKLTRAEVGPFGRIAGDA